MARKGSPVFRLLLLCLDQLALCRVAFKRQGSHQPLLETNTRPHLLSVLGFGRFLEAVGSLRTTWEQTVPWPLFKMRKSRPRGDRTLASSHEQVNGP